MRRPLILIAGLCMFGWTADSSAHSPLVVEESSNQDEPARPDRAQNQEAEIRALIEQLVYSDEPVANQPIINPNMKIVDADGNARPINGDSDEGEKQRQRFNSCQEAFNKLIDMREAAIPYLVEHLDDERQSINFRNHYLGNSVGDACYWNIYLQLQDRPRGYSRYGYSRKGRDGKNHPKPYWEGTPFDDAGGLKKWLEANKQLSYAEMQIKCLQWLLDREKEIGASDAESYFINILPLEIQILKRRMEDSDDVKNELERLITIRDKKLIDQIPKKLLPEN